MLKIIVVIISGCNGLNHVHQKYQAFMLTTQKECYLTWRKSLSDVIGPPHLEIIWRLSGWILNAITIVHVSEKQREIAHTQREGKAKTKQRQM